MKMKTETPKSEKLIALEKECKEAYLARYEAEKTYDAAMRGIIEDFCKEHGVAFAKVEFVDYQGRIHLSHGGYLNVDYRRRWCADGEDSKKRDVTLNISACGSYTKQDVETVEYYAAAGIFSAGMDELERRFASVSWADLDAKTSAANNLRWDVGKERQALEADLLAHNKVEALSWLKQGVYVGNAGRPRSAREIFKVTPMRVYFAINRWTNKTSPIEEVVDGIARGNLEVFTAEEVAAAKAA